MPAVVRAILTHVGAPAEVPAVAAARAPPQVPLWPRGCDIGVVTRPPVNAHLNP